MKLDTLLYLLYYELLIIPVQKGFTRGDTGMNIGMKSESNTEQIWSIYLRLPTYLTTNLTTIVNIDGNAIITPGITSVLVVLDDDEEVTS